MPGHRDGRAGRVARIRTRYWTRLKATSSDIDRLGVAVDHLRVAVAKCAGPEQRKAVIDAAVADLVGPAEELLTHYETRGRKR